MSIENRLVLASGKLVLLKRLHLESTLINLRVLLVYFWNHSEQRRHCLAPTSPESGATKDRLMIGLKELNKCLRDTS